MNKEMIKIIDEAGVQKEVEVVAFFTLKMNNKKYLIYTDGTRDASGNYQVCTSEVIENPDNTISLAGIDDDAVWVEIKKVMLDIAKDGE